MGFKAEEANNRGFLHARWWCFEYETARGPCLPGRGGEGAEGLGGAGGKGNADRRRVGGDLTARMLVVGRGEEKEVSGCLREHF